MGSWKTKSVTNTISSEMEAWAKKAWRLKGNMSFHPLNQNLFFMGFDLTEEADWVMENGSQICRGEAMLLERWNPSTGCMRSKGQYQEVWLRVVGLPLHLWTEEILVTIGDSFGGFVAMDEETSLMKNLLWARILVKMKSAGRPTSVNLLAGARSYEIQLWWEIQPRVTEVYPRRFRRETEMANPSVEDAGKTRADGRVIAERGTKGHILQVVQRDMGHWQALHKSGTEGILRQNLDSGGSTRVGATSQCEFQRICGKRRRVEGAKPLREFLSRSPGPHNGDETGQSPTGLPSVGLGQSPHQKSRAARPTEAFRQEDKKKDQAGLMGKRERGMARPNLVESQTSDTPGIGEEGDQRQRLTQDQGQRKDNTSKGGVCGKGRRTSMEDRGSQTDNKESSPHDSDRGLDLIPVHPKIGRDEGASFGGEKIQTLFPRPGGDFGRFSLEIGRKFKDYRDPNSREGKPPASNLEDVEDDISQEGRTEYTDAKRLGKVDGMWPSLMSTVGRISLAQHDREALRSGHGRSMIRGLNSSKGSVMEAGRTQGKEVDLGCSIQTCSGPKTNFSSPLEELGSSGPTCSEGMEMGVGTIQGKLMRSPRQQKCFCSGGMEGTVEHNPETGETGEENSQEKEGCNNNRYDDKFYEKSPSALIFVFGRPLLPGDISCLGSFNGEEDLEPLMVIMADGREWGTKSSCELIEEGEGLAVADRRTIEIQNESSKLRTYERWEKSCLAKFSDFLGFPTKGFEKEITKLLRDLVRAQKLGKGKDCQTVSKSERELRKLEWTINYKGKEISREDGRDKGKLLLKLNED